MPESGPLLGAEQIRKFLVEMAELLGPDGEVCTVVVVGGSVLALHELREATRDVDCISRLDEQLRIAASEVARRHDLSPHWLNDNAAA